MKLNKLKDILDIARDTINRKNKELEDIKINIIIERTACEEDLLLLDFKQELMEKEQKNIEELQEICNKYENKLEEVEDEV